jgi:hypothetical protein
METTKGHQMNTCTWLIHGTPRWVNEAYDADPDFGWYPDSPSDLISECGADVTRTDEGWECAAGHSHFYGAEYFDDEEIAGMTQRGIALPANARRIDGAAV